MKAIKCVWLLITISIFSFHQLKAQEEDLVRFDVPYVPTNEKVVTLMLDMAEITAEDVIYDLGCGDGRILITAALKYGARGVGVDINPERIKEAQANAEKAEVTDKVTFIEGDLFETDFSEATVLALYLLPSVNLSLRPQIKKMPAGTRVVSHNYNMGDWTPDKMERIMTPSGFMHTVYFWRVGEKDK
ncbi:MAG: SAM-dependent methyltransferase [Candidatus Cyclobacteriaceae bacterium M3_2C_046]